MIASVSTSAAQTGDKSGRAPGSPRSAVRLIFQDISYIEVTFVIVALLLASRPKLGLIGISGAGDSVSGNPIEQGIWIIIYLVCGGLLLAHSRGKTTYMGRGALPYIVVLWAGYSLLWTSSFDVSLKRLIALIGSTLIGTYLGARFTWRQLFTAILWVTGLAAILSLTIEVLLPMLQNPDAAWQGIYSHKNWLGRMMAFSASIWLVAFLSNMYSRVLSLAILALSIALVLLSESAASLVAVMILLASVPLLLTRRMNAPVRWATLSLLLGLGALLSLRWTPDSDSILTALGRDTTLTGRMALWEDVWMMIDQHPWVGHGYGGFWLGWGGPSAEIWQRNYWLPPNAHNGFYDILLELGWIGLILFAISFVSVCAQAIQKVSNRTSVIAVFPSLFLIFLIMSNLAESNLVTHNSIYWILFTALSLQLARGLDMPSDALDPIDPDEAIFPCRSVNTDDMTPFQKKP